MKKYIFLATILAAAFSLPAASAAEIAKLPYMIGERFVVSNGYWSPPMHIKKDSYALDFTQRRCDAYGKYVLAATSGTVSLAADSGYNGGYGTEVLVRDVHGMTERYAHMIPGSVSVGEGETVSQGTIIGEIGNTGLVIGTDCAVHPGAHIHFAVYAENSEKVFVAYNPEPISGYVNFKEGEWYVSDNVLAATKGNLAVLAEILGGLLDGKNISVEPSRVGSVIASNAPEANRETERPTLPSRSQISTSIPEQAGPSVPRSAAIVPLVVPSPPQSTPASTSFSTSSVHEFFSSSGGGITGGVSVATPIVTTASTSVLNNIQFDDPVDDTVPSCK